MNPDPCRVQNGVGLDFSPELPTPLHAKFAAVRPERHLPRNRRPVTPTGGINREIILAYAAHLRDVPRVRGRARHAEPLSLATQRKYLGALRNLLRRAKDKGRIGIYVAAEIEAGFCQLRYIAALVEAGPEKRP